MLICNKINNQRTNFVFSKRTAQPIIELKPITKMPQEIVDLNEL